MAVNVLVIPEDFRKDQYVLRPIVEAMMKAHGVKARVNVCTDPLLGGIGEALKWERLVQILDQYRGMVRLFLLLVDRDCDANRRTSLNNLEARAKAHLGVSDKSLLAENAWQEVEVWALAGQLDLPRAWKWRELRAHRDPKEHYYDAYAAQRGLLRGPYEGRQTIASESARNYDRLLQLCPEDLGTLHQRVGTALGLLP